MKTITARIVSICLAGMLLAGCGGDSGTSSTADGASGGTSGETSAKEIRIARPYDITSLDSQEANDDGSYEILNLIGEGLVRVENGEVVPGVAESWEQSEDGMEYTFHLRQDAVWSDGTPLTAADFQYTYLRLIDPEAAHYHADKGYLFKNGEKYLLGEASPEEVGIEVVDEHTLKITREQPSLETLYSLARYPYFPVNREKAESGGIAYGAQADSILTNGAYTLTQWSHEDKIVLEKNQNYWNKDAIHLDKITGVVGAAGETAVDMMMAGELELMVTNDYPLVEKLEAAGYAVDSYTSGYQFVHMNIGGNTEQSGRFMGNENFRRALSLAVNREAIVSSVYRAATPANRISSPNDMGVSGPFVEEYPYEGFPAAGDPDKAKEYLELALEELGATVEDIPTLSMLCFESQNSLTVLQAVQDMLLTNLGIESTIDPQPIQQMIAKAMEGEWDSWWGGKSVGVVDWASDDSVATSFDYTDPSTVNNYENQAYTDMLKALKVTLDMKERKDLLFEMEQELCDNPGSILIGWQQQYVVSVQGLRGALLDTEVNITYMDMD